MPITMQQVLARLDTDEPDYAALATLGPEAVPHLKVLVQSDDPGIAAKAAYLASLIESDDSTEVIEAASASPHDTVRVAAAAGMRNLAPDRARATVERLLDDDDAGVRKQAVHAVRALDLQALEPKVRKIAARDPEKGIRQLARGFRGKPNVESAAPRKARAAKKKTAKKAAKKKTAKAAPTRKK